MKKTMIILAIFTLLCLVGCSTEQGQYEETTTAPTQSEETTAEPEKEEYQWVIDDIDLSANMYEIIAEAQNKGFVMNHNGDVLMGEESFAAFYEKYRNGQEASLQYCTYFLSYDEFMLREIYYDTEKVHRKTILQRGTITYETYNLIKHEENDGSTKAFTQAAYFLADDETESYYNGKIPFSQVIWEISKPSENKEMNAPKSPEDIEWEIDRFELSKNGGDTIARAKENGFFVSDYICTEVSGYEKVTEFLEKYQNGQEARLKILKYDTDAGPIYLTELYYDTEYIYYKEIEQGGIIKWDVYKFVYFEEEDFTTAKITWLFLTNIEDETRRTHVGNMVSISHHYCTAKQIRVKSESK